MEDKSFSISLKCMFCDCALEGETEQEFSSGDMIKCQECGELNDYDALIELAKEEGKEAVTVYAQSEIEKMLKKAFK
jgi:peptide subunit release factor 1 (eRF1)